MKDLFTLSIFLVMALPVGAWLWQYLAATHPAALPVLAPLLVGLALIGLGNALFRG